MSKSFSSLIGTNEFKTTVVTNESELEVELQWLFSVIEKQSCKHKYLGRFVVLGIEKSFSNRVDGAVIEKVAVLKLCAEDFCLILHLSSFKKIPTSLSKFLDLSDIIVVGFGINQNLCDLRRDYGIHCRSVVAELTDLYPAFRKDRTLRLYTLVDLYKLLFGFTPVSESLAKSANVAFDDWGSSLLSDKQIYYASREVCATFMVAKHLLFDRFMVANHLLVDRFRA
jgi:hypothetical protein